MRKILFPLCLVLALICSAMCVFGFSSGDNVAHAAAVTTPMYQAQFNYTHYKVSNTSSSVAGSGSNVTSTTNSSSQYGSATVSIRMYGSGYSGNATLANGGYLNSNAINISVSSGWASHSVKVYNSSGSEVLSGSTSVSGTLGDGTYTCTYAATGTGWLVNNRQYDNYKITCTYTFRIDTVSPSISGASTAMYGQYTNAGFTVSSSDNASGIANLYVKKPLDSDYTAYGSSISIPAGSLNGLYIFFAKDNAGNISPFYHVNYDNTAPTGRINNASGTNINGGYATGVFKYYTNDNYSGISYCQHKVGNGSWETYSQGTGISSNVGWHYFRAVDKAGNISAESKVYFDNVAPTLKLTTPASASVASGGSFSVDWIKFSASDAESGLSTCYVKLPGTSTYSVYTPNTQLTTEGLYSFYAVDVAGNSSSVVTIRKDVTIPSATLYSGSTSVASGTFSKASYVMFTATDSGSGIQSCLVKLPSASSFNAYTSGTQLTAEGVYSFKAIDNAGNETATMTITLDRTAPTLTIYSDATAVTSGYISNKASIKFSAIDSNSGIASCYIKAPSASGYVSCMSGTSYIAEGVYKFYAVDKSGNQCAEQTITLDKTKPIGQLYGGSFALNNGSATNASYIKYTASDSLSGVNKLYVKTPSDAVYVEYTSGSQYTAEGTYFFYTVDKAGNASDISTATIDLTLPVGNLYADGVLATSGSKTNKAVKYVASDNSGTANCFVKMPNATSYTAYASGTELTVEGTYSFYATDSAGNKSSVQSILYDKTAPAYALYAETNKVLTGAFTNLDYVKFIATDTNSGLKVCYVKVPNSSNYLEYASGTQLADNGAYSFYAVDNAGNESIPVSITLDSGIPIGTLFANGEVANIGCFTNAQYITFDGYDTLSGISVLNVRKPDISVYEEYVAGTQLTEEGIYYFKSVDLAGNVSIEYYLTVDRTIPVGVLYADNEVIESGSYTAKSLKYSASDVGSDVDFSEYKAPNSNVWTAYTDGTVIDATEAKGTYLFRSVDLAGNVSEVSEIYLDDIAPIGAIAIGGIDVENGKYTSQPFSYTASDADSGVDYILVKYPDTNEWITYENGSVIANTNTNGWYQFKAYDRSGNVSELAYVFLDTEKPLGQLYSGITIVADGTHTKDTIKYVAIAVGSDIDFCEVKLAGSDEWTEYTSGTALASATNGTYSFRSTDIAGNVSKIGSIVLDTVAPVGQLYVGNTPTGNNTYTNGERIKFMVLDENLKECFIKLPATDDFVSYNSGTIYSDEGRYSFYGLDYAGNSTGTFTIVIDRQPKALTVNGVESGKTNGNVTITWRDITSIEQAPIASVKVNDIDYTKNDTIVTLGTGRYNVECVDMAGNTWTTSFVSTKSNILTETVNKEWWEAKDVLGNTYSFESYDKALSFAIAREKTYVRSGVWANEAEWDTGIMMDNADSVNAKTGTYFIYKKTGDASTDVAYFTEARLNAVIEEYASDGIRKYFYWQKTPATVGNGNIITSLSDSGTILAKAITLAPRLYYEIDGEGFSGTEYTIEGNHTVSVSDDWGNSASYTFIVVRQAPTIEYAVGSGSFNAVTFEQDGYYLKNTVSVRIADSVDDLAMFYVKNAAGETIYTLNLGDIATFTESGKYVVQSVNHFGTSKELVIYISLNSSTITMTDNEVAKRFEIEVIKSTDSYTAITNLFIYKSTDGGETWTLLSTDDYGTAISTNTLKYKFRTSAMYKAVVEDAFRSGIDSVVSTADFVKDAPVGVLNGVENGGYTNGVVSFVWTDEAVVVLNKDGSVFDYTSGQKLTADGVYSLTFSDYDNHSTTYNFTIDTLSPEITLEGVENGGTTNSNVRINWTESDITVQLTLGENTTVYEKGSAIRDDGSYSIVATDLAGNTTAMTFVIDKSVDYVMNTVDGGVSNEDVVINNKEPLSISMVYNEAPMDYAFGNTLTDEGKYTATIADSYGNSKTVEFRIQKSALTSFYYVPKAGTDIMSVVGDDNELWVAGEPLVFNKDGIYTVTLDNNGTLATFTIIIDTTAPSVVLQGVTNGGVTKGEVTLTELSEAATLQAFFNGEAFEYKLGDTLTEVGLYRFVFTDEVGNESEYSFEIKYSLNTVSIVLIVLGIVLLGVLIALIVLGKKGKFKRKKNLDDAFPAEEPTTGNEQDDEEDDVADDD